VLTKLNKTAQGSKNKRLSVLLMGFVFSLTSFTCTVPFFSNLVFAFHKGETSMALAGMTAYATVFALPFFLLAMFPSLIKAMPRSGGWMNSVKVVMGFLELGAALKFISNADLVLAWEFFNRDLILAAWIAIAILITIYLLGRFQLSHDSAVEHIGAVRVLLAVMFLSSGIYLYTGLHGRPLGKLDAFLPPAGYATASFGSDPGVAGGPPLQTASAEAQWHERYSDALAEAKRTGKNVFIDFTGYTCTNCRAMESTVFTRPEVKALFKDFVLTRLYTDNGSPLNDSNRTMEEERFNTIALPYYVIISPDDKTLGEFPGYTPDHASFTAFLTQHKVASPQVAIASVE
jgi:thiol:disulfide interchange protein